VVRDLVAGLQDRGSLLGERLDGVARDEEGGAKVALLQEMEQARDADARSDSPRLSIAGVTRS